MQNAHRFLVAIFCLLPFGCGIYTHTGASVSPDIKTFSVSYINNVASIVNPTLSQIITEKLKQKFVNETPLKLTTGEGDLSLSGKITSYEIKPVAVQGDQQNALNRLSISMEVSCDNHKQNEKSFTQTFSNYYDFPATDNFQARESELADKVATMLVQDIFNKTFIDW